jgi:transcriptional antiterminator RfaH
MASPNLHWYVVRSKYRNEALLWQQLCSQQMEVYYPRIYKQTVKSTPQKVRPCFPGYMFIRVDLDAVGRSRLQWMPGCLGLVCFGGEPAYVADNILYGIRERVDWMNSGRIDVSNELRSGEEVEIYSGPFAGYRGIFSSYLSDQERATVFLRFIHGQQIRVELPVTQIALSKQRRNRL